VIAVNTLAALVQSRCQLFRWALPASVMPVVAANKTTYASDQRMEEVLGKV
jgi:hypothetical protein